MRVLVIEDDPALSNILVRILKEESYAVDLATDGQEGEWLAFENPYDVIILDLMLPTKDGLSVLKALRDAKISTPVLILTARDAKDDVVKGLDIGADDYVTKPFDVEELIARVRALLRRKATTTDTILQAGPLTVDPTRKEVRFGGENVELTSKEYGLLEYFMRNVGSVLTRTQLSEHVWDQNFEPTSNVVDVYIGYLRNKIDKRFGQNVIKTIRGHGYMLDLPLPTVENKSAGSEQPAQPASVSDNAKPEAPEVHAH
jgi:DNA-binding response OmpR family regulator